MLSALRTVKSTSVLLLWCVSESKCVESNGRKRETLHTHDTSDDIRFEFGFGATCRLYTLF